MTTAVETLWADVQAVLAGFAVRLTADDPSLRHQLGRTANEAFSLRAYLAFRKSADGDEVAVTVDVQNDGSGLVIASDVCAEDGRVIADGPSAVIPLSGAQTGDEVALASWLSVFEQFLLNSEQKVRTELARLS